MRAHTRTAPLGGLAVWCTLLLLPSNQALAHCDGLDGPVVQAAQKALATADVDLTLVWVQPSDESEIRKAFEQTLLVRELSPAAKELADRSFFETLVRVHRAGEAAPYTGLKPAGRDLGPAIPASDKALESRSVEQLVKLLRDALEGGVRARFQEAVEKSSYKPDDVEAGREYVKAYVEFIHYVERIYEAARNPTAGHFSESDAHTAHSVE